MSYFGVQKANIIPTTNKKVVLCVLFPQKHKKHSINFQKIKAGKVHQQCSALFGNLMQPNV
jgi:hypothetical protein